MKLYLVILTLGCLNYISAFSQCPENTFYKRKVGCLPCTKCHKLGLLEYKSCSSFEDTLCGDESLYGQPKSHLSIDPFSPSTLGPTHEIRKNVLNSESRESMLLQKIRNAYGANRGPKKMSHEMDGKIKYEEDDTTSDNLHNDLKAIEQKLYQEKLAEKNGQLSEPIVRMSTLKPPSVISKTYKSFSTDPNESNANEVLDKSFQEPEVFGQFVSESPNQQESPVDDVKVIHKVLTEEKKTNNNGSIVESSFSSTSFSSQIKYMAMVFGLIVFCLLIAITGLLIRKYYKLRKFKLLASLDGGESRSKSRDSQTSRCSSIRRGLDSRLTSSSTVPESPLALSLTGDMFSSANQQTSPSMVDQSGNTTLCKEQSRELSV